jgi:hypothetical protein
MRFKKTSFIVNNLHLEVAVFYLRPNLGGAYFVLQTSILFSLQSEGFTENRTAWVVIARRELGGGQNCPSIKGTATGESKGWSSPEV